MKFFDELKRRNIIKATIAYIVVAWILLQLIDTILPNFETPLWVFKTLTFVIAIGLPIWMIFSWVYEVTPEGLKKTSQISNEQSITAATNKRLNIIIIITLIIAIGVAFINKPISNIFSKTNDNSKLTTYKSIAVLPFVNMSGDTEQEYLADGLSEELINTFTKLPELKVIGRTSSFAFKGKNEDLRVIGRSLEVEYLLEGSVRKSEDKIRISVKLIHCKDGSLLWSNTYNRKLDDIFEIQDEISSSVLTALRITLSNNKSFSKPKTINIEAYNYFLQAREQSHKATKIGYTNAISLYKKAIALDSNFIEAYYHLAEAHGATGGIWGIINERQAWEKQKSLLRKVVEIDSSFNIDGKDANMQLNFGSFLYEWNFEVFEKNYQTNLDQGISVPYGYAAKTGRFDVALSEMNKVILKYPTASFFYALKAEALYYLDKKDEALDFLETTDPLYNNDMDYLRETAKLYYYLGNYEKSKNQLKRLMTIFPDRTPIILWLNAIHLRMEGNNKESEKYLNEIIRKYSEQFSGSPAWFIALYYCVLTDYEQAFIWLQNSFDRHEAELTWLREEPLLIPLRNDERYKTLYRKVGFPMKPHGFPE